MNEPTVIDCIITKAGDYPRPSNGDCVVLADMSDGTTTQVLFYYYSDELHFQSYEFIGKTEHQAHQLFHQKDIAYLRS